MDVEMRDDGVELEPCYRCGYLIDCEIGVVCSECGYCYRSADVVVVEKRAELMAGAGRRIRMRLWMWVGIWVVYTVGGLGAMWIVDSQMPWEIVYFMVGVLGALIWGSIGLGWLISRMALEHQRRLVWMIWLETLPGVHMSWLSIAGFTGGGVVLSFLGSLIGDWGGGKDSGGLEMVMTGYVVLAFVVWLLGSVALIMIWGGKLSELANEYDVRSGQGIGAMAVLAFVSWGMGCLVGLMGGVLGVGVISSVGL